MWRNLIRASAMVGVMTASVALGDDETDRTPAGQLTIRCLQLVRVESSFPPTSSQQSLEAHQLRMRTICWDWRALATSQGPERIEKSRALLDRCVNEAQFDLARAHALYYTRHVKGVEQMCRDFAAIVVDH